MALKTGPHSALSKVRQEVPKVVAQSRFDRCHRSNQRDHLGGGGISPTISNDVMLVFRRKSRPY